ncbi:MAG: ribonuclease Z [Muribaculaceae bacterium]
MDKFELNILGCGSATTSLRHMPSSQVLNIRDNLFMIDCGEAAQLAMLRQRLKFVRLNHIFISHLHGDHCFGLPGLLSTLDLHGRSGPLTIHINADGAKHFGDFFNFFLNGCSYNIQFNIIGSRKAVIYEDDAITVTALPLKHRVPTMGFLFEEKPKLRHLRGDMVRFHNVPLHMYNNLRQGKDYITPEGNTIPNNVLTTDADPSISYAYCSDTAFSQRLINMLHQPTWIYHEATYTDEYAKLAKQRGHSTARQAAIVARETGAKNLILGHFSKRYVDEQLFADEARQDFDGRIVIANEGMKIDLTK